VANLVHNEQVKLLANLLNTMAAASVTIGVIAPFSAMIFKGGDATLSLRTGVYAIFWLTVWAILHAAARQVLKGLRE